MNNPTPEFTEPTVDQEQTRRPLHERVQETRGFVEGQTAEGNQETENADVEPTRDNDTVNESNEERQL